MARLFDDAQSEYLERNQAVLSGTPLAFVCWFNSNDNSNYQMLFTLADKDVAESYHELQLQNAAGGQKVRAVTSNVTQGIAITTTAWSLDTWQHVCGIFASSTDRRVLLDSGSKGTDATDKTPPSLDRTNIGCRHNTLHDYFMSGMIAEAAVWDLSDWPGATASDKADNFEKIVASLAKGFSPLHFPLGLKAYWPLVRGTNI